MAIYRADIDIAVRGATQVTNLQQRLNTLNTNVNQLNATLRSGTVSSLNNLNNLVSQSDRIMRSAAQGTRVQREAIDAYVRSIAAAEQAETSLQRAIGRRRRELGIAAPAPAGGRRDSFGSRIGGAVSGAVIGGSFPLLFGQGGGAATGGAIGGLLGGLAGPGGSFAGSLFGTLLGDIVSKGNQVKKLGEDIGFSAQQTRLLEGAFKQAGAEFDKFEASVQNIRGLSLDIGDQANAIRLVSTLTEKYGGEIDKITNAYTSALESGKVTQATLNQLTSQGIPIQQALADKYKVSRSEILQMAKDGKISVQELSDTLVDMGNKGVAETNKTKSGFDNLKTSVISLGSELAGLGGSIVGIFEGPFNWLLNSIGNVIQQASNGIAVLRDFFNFSTPEAAKAKAAIQAGRLPVGTQGIIDVIGEKRFRQLGEQAGPGWFGIGRDINKFIQILQQQPEFKATPPTPLQKIKVPGQLPPSSGSSGSSGRSAADKAADAAAKEAARVAEVIRARQLATIELQRQAVFSAAIAAAELNKDQILTRQLQGNQELVQLGIQVADALEKETNSSAQLAIAREFQAKKALVLLGIELDIAKIKQEHKEQYDTIISDLDTELALKYAITEQERTQLRIAAEMKKLEQSSPFLTQDRLAIIQQGKERLAAPKTGSELILERTGTLEDELTALTDLGNIATSIADGIGSAFANSFKGIISGSMSAREALAGFFQSVADAFLDMAAQIIAKWIQMTILNSILRLFPGGGGAGGLGSVDANLAQYAPLPNANGNVFGMNGIMPFAKGGIVNRPTLFPFANGTGLMGEAGPEAILPLRRGANGRLGVEATGGGSTSVVVNVDAQGTNVQGNEPDARALGTAVSVAVQAEIVKQQRPGGLLAGTR